MIRVLIVSGLGLLRGALRAVLAHEEDLEVTELEAGQDAVAVVRRWEPHVTLVDLTADERGGLRLARRASQASGTAVVALAEQQTPALLRRALDAGVRGFLATAQSAEELPGLIRRIAAGDLVIDPSAALAALSTADNPLTPREQEVLRLAAKGLPTKAIARALFLTDGTVRNHVVSILRKTGTHNRMQAIRRASEAGWI